jgi:hypothetical protein
MTMPSLDVGSGAWRAAQAATWLGGAVRNAVSGDDVLDGLRELGDPPGGWWEIIAATRKIDPPGIVLALPRPGDPRGVPPLPDAVVEGGVAWNTANGITWLLATDDGAWRRVEAPGGRVSMASLAATDSELRSAVVSAAHALDGRVANPLGAGVPRNAERIVDCWLESAAPLSGEARALAARGLRLLALESLATEGDLVHGVTANEAEERRSTLRRIEPCARSAVEAAYSTHLT